MKYKALYREKRPEVFSQVLGQEHIVRILRNQIATDTVSHAYLFCGTRGTGKTTVARILAKAVNCTGDTTDRPCGTCDSCRAIAEGNFIDVIEIDAASNRGIDEIRELRESVNYPPSAGRMKVYIVDEVHMLTTPAFNALLKTLEEPPENVMFILATTDPEKLPQTILSRCMRLDFKRVSSEKIRDNIREICRERNVEITEGALALLAGNADGSVRDSLSLLEQCLSGGDRSLTRDSVVDFLGAASEEFYFELTEKVLTRNVAEALIIVDRVLREGKDVRQILRDWMEHYRGLLIAKFVSDPENILNMSIENIEELKAQSDKADLEEINQGIRTLAKTIEDSRYSSQARVLLEVATVALGSGLEYGRPQAQAGPPRKLAPAEPFKVAEEAKDRGSENKEAGETESEFSPEELAAIWEDVLEEAMVQVASLSMGRKSNLAGITEREFKVLVESDMAKQRLEANRSLVNELMEKRVGRPVAMVCKPVDQPEAQSREEELQEIASRASDALGIDVQIK